MHHLEGVGWDGNTLWTALDGTLNRHDEESYEVEAVYPMGAQPAAIAFRGQELWVGDKIWGKIYRLDTSSLPEQGYPTEDGYIFDITAEVPDEADPPVLNTYSIVEKPYALTWSNDNLWVYDLATKCVYKIKKLPETSLDPEDEYLEGGQEFTIPEEVSGNVTWTQENSPYVIEYGFEVPENSTLNIEPGVTILLKQGDFMVRGILQAVGTSDQPIVFSHKDEEDTAWGNFIFEGREAGESTLRHVRIQYQDINGVMAINAAPTIEYSAIRHGGGLSYDLETGEYGTIMVRGNRFNEASVGVSVSAKATVDQIVVRGNTFRYGLAEFLGVDVENGPTPVVVEHNIVEDFKGAATNFNGNLNLTFRHNLVRNVISYRGIAPAIEGKSNIRYNYFEYVDPPIQTAYRDLENASILYNTMKYPYGPFESNFNKSGVQVEYNNFIPYPKMEIWAISIDEIDVDTWGGFSAEMPHNWWGTSDRSVIDEHIYDSKDTESRGPLIIEPILEEPNGIGFVQGTVINAMTGEPITKATVQVSDASLLTAVTGEFFTALPEGGQRVRVSAAGYRSNEVVVNVTAAESESVVIRLVPEDGS